jgi:Mg2+ and Co2+ transporter CorA
MSVYEIMNTYNTWGTQEALAAQREDYDLISMVILRLGKPEYENVDDVFRILNALLYQRTEKAYDVIKEYVDFSDALNREVENMFSFGKMIHEDGKEVGRQEVMRSMCENGFSLDVIAKIMKLPLEQVQEILQSSMIPMR